MSYLRRVREAPGAAMRARVALLLPFSCRWNAIVRDLSAKLEKQGDPTIPTYLG